MNKISVKVILMLFGFSLSCGNNFASQGGEVFIDVIGKLPPARHFMQTWRRPKHETTPIVIYERTLNYVDASKPDVSENNTGKILNHAPRTRNKQPQAQQKKEWFSEQSQLLLRNINMWEKDLQRLKKRLPTGLTEQDRAKLKLLRTNVDQQMKELNPLQQWEQIHTDKTNELKLDQLLQNLKSIAQELKSPKKQQGPEDLKISNAVENGVQDKINRFPSPNERDMSNTLQQRFNHITTKEGEANKSIMHLPANRRSSDSDALQNVPDKQTNNDSGKLCKKLSEGVTRNVIEILNYIWRVLRNYNGNVAPFLSEILSFPMFFDVADENFPRQLIYLKPNQHSRIIVESIKEFINWMHQFQAIQQKIISDLDKFQDATHTNMHTSNAMQDLSDFSNEGINPTDIQVVTEVSKQVYKGFVDYSRFVNERMSKENLFGFLDSLEKLQGKANGTKNFLRTAYFHSMGVGQRFANDIRNQFNNIYDLTKMLSADYQKVRQIMQAIVCELNLVLKQMEVERLSRSNFMEELFGKFPPFKPSSVVDIQPVLTGIIKGLWEGEWRIKLNQAEAMEMFSYAAQKPIERTFPGLSEIPSEIPIDLLNYVIIEIIAQYYRMTNNTAEVTFIN